jgi:hypothetical protein
MGEENEGKRESEALPPAAQVYLSVWAMGVTPEGKAMRVETAARLAGVSTSTVKDWRSRIAGFRELEAQARASSSSYVQRLARKIVESLVVPAGGVLARGLQADNVGLAWNIIKAAGGIASVVDVESGERLTRLLEELRDLEDEEEEDCPLTPALSREGDGAEDDGEMADGESEEEAI